MSDDNVDEIDDNRGGGGDGGGVFSIRRDIQLDLVSTTTRC